MLMHIIPALIYSILKLVNSTTTLVTLSSKSPIFNVSWFNITQTTLQHSVMITDVKHGDHRTGYSQTTWIQKVYAVQKSCYLQLPPHLSLHVLFTHGTSVGCSCSHAHQLSLAGLEDDLKLLHLHIHIPPLVVWPHPLLALFHPFQLASSAHRPHWCRLIHPLTSWAPYAKQNRLDWPMAVQYLKYILLWSPGRQTTADPQ